jgi:FkbM family methyltransferase
MANHRLIDALKSVRYARRVANWPGVGAAAWRGRDVTRLQLRNGWVIEGAPRSGLLALYKDIWYRDFYRLQSQPLPPGQTIIDIGANVGVFALLAVAYAQPARVLCYEPAPECFALLQRNIERNRIALVQAFQRAVAGSSGARELGIAAWHASNTLYAAPSAPSVTVECVTLAEIFETHRIERCGFLKVDCEGAEYEILLQAPASILARIDRVALEYHDAATLHRHNELEDLFRGHGFQVERDGGTEKGHLFATRSS